MSILMLGHLPISSLKLNACLCSLINFMRVPFSSGVRSELVKSIYLYKISSSIMSLLGSSSSNQGYGSFLWDFGESSVTWVLQALVSTCLGLVIISRMYIWYLVGRGEGFYYFLFYRRTLCFSLML